MEDLPQEFLTENSSINVEFLENKTWGITSVGNLLSIGKLVNSVRQIMRGALLIYNYAILGLKWQIVRNWEILYI